MYRLAHLWAFGFVVAGHAILLMAVLVAVGVTVSPAMLEPQFPATTLGLRFGMGAMILAGGVVFGGALVLTGQRLLVLLDQRRLLRRILREVKRPAAAAPADAESPRPRPPLGGRVGRRL